MEFYLKNNNNRMAVVDWSELPKDVIARIVENHLVSVDDYVMVSNICRSWHDAALSCDKAKLMETWARRQMPWLMLTDGNEEPFSIFAGDESSGDEDIYYTQTELEDLQKLQDDSCGNLDMENNIKRDLLNIWRNNKRYSVDCTEGYGRLCWGSPYGWIVTTGLDHDIYMFNPLTRSRLDLPSRLTFPNLAKKTNLCLRQLFISKAVVLKVPSNGKETIMVVALHVGEHDGSVASAKPGDKRWMPININGNPHFAAGVVDDVMYHHDQGLLLLLNKGGGLGFCDLRNNEQPLLLLDYFDSLLHKPTIHDYNIDIGSGLRYHPYIVSFGKDILMVFRLIEVEYSEHTGYVTGYKTIDFKVYRFCFDTKYWEELLQQDLLNMTFFVGNNTTMYVCASDQEAVGSDHNRSCTIYFTDDHLRDYRGIEDGLGGRDIGVFRMCDRSSNFFSEGSNLRSSYCCPLWFRPSL